MVGYRGFQQPSLTSVSGWMTWLSDEKVLLPAAPRPAESCRYCQGAVLPRDDGEYWPQCVNCLRYGGVIDHFVPISYSIDSGLESMLHRFKDWEDSRWLQAPLGSMLYTFLEAHRDCIEDTVGLIDVAAIVPSDNRKRVFNHLHKVLTTVKGEPLLKWFRWKEDLVQRDFSVPRPPRGHLSPDAYLVDDFARGRTVLVFDDTWTSGSSIASCAAALKKAGATRVVALTLGRQLKESFGSSDRIIKSVQERTWTADDCVLCVG